MPTRGKTGVAGERTEPRLGTKLPEGLGSGCFRGRFHHVAQEALPQGYSPRCLGPYPETPAGGASGLPHQAQTSDTRRYRRETARVFRIGEVGGGRQARFVAVPISGLAQRNGLNRFQRCVYTCHAFTKTGSRRAHALRRRFRPRKRNASGLTPRGDSL